MISRKIINDGFPLTDFFKEGEEIVLFSNEQDLYEKTLLYLNQSDERNSIASNAYEKSCTLFNYKSIAETIIKDVRERLKKMAEEIQYDSVITQDKLNNKLKPGNIA